MSKKKLAAIFISWRFIISAAAVAALSTLPFKDSFPYRDAILEQFGHPLFYSWGNFDGVHYLGIAINGYSAQFTQAFFPLYSLLIRYLSIFTQNYILSGLIISHICFALALWYLYKLIRIDFKHTVAYGVVLLITFFPTSFYFGSVYTESIFLLLSVLSFYWAKKDNWIAASIAAGLASATRLVGIFLLPALLVELWPKLKKQKTLSARLKTIAPLVLATTGLLAYMLFLNHKFADPLYFVNAQPAFGAERSTDKLILLYQVIFRYAKMFVTVPPTSLLFYTVTQEFVISIGFLGLLIAAFKKIPKSYTLYAALAYIIPTLTGTFSSMPRYVLVLFPGFLALSLFIKPKYRWLWLVPSIILLIINTALFTRGYWIA